MTRRSLFGTVLGAVGAAVTSAFVSKPKVYEIWMRDFQFEHSTEQIDFFLCSCIDNYPYMWATKSYYHTDSKFAPRLFNKNEAEKVIRELNDPSANPRNIWMQEVSGS